MRRPGATAAAMGAAGLLALPASAQVPGDAVRVEPNTAGKGSHVILDMRVSEDPRSAGRSPQSVVLAAERGFKFDPRARSERCSPERAKGFDCPGNSRIGTGTAAATVSNGVFSQDVTIDVEIYLGPPPQSGDVAGVVLEFRERSSGQQATTTGRVVKTAGAFGLELRFDDLGSTQSAAPEGFQVRVNRLQADAGASRTEKVKRYRYVRRNGKRKRVAYYKKVRRDLIRNPLTCDGTWAYQLRVRYSPTDESVRDASGPCED